MASNYTEHYKLNQWSPEDKVLRTEFNEDNQKIDAALGSLSGAVAKKAEQSALTAAVSRVAALEAGKAEKTALTAEQTARQNADSAEKAAREAADTQLRNENCWVKLGEWTLNQSAKTFSCPISAPETYAELRCLGTMAAEGRINADINGGVDLLLSDRESVYRGVSLISNACPQGGGGVIRILPLAGLGTAFISSRWAGINSKGYVEMGKQTFCTHTLPYRDLTSIDLSSNYNTMILAGAKFTLYGLKK